jgi:uncharacterized repeat protein (TIGR01451 family)
MNLRSILLLGLAALAGGCASPNLERIATIQSRAEALYAYGGVATFPVSSELVEVSVYAPVHHEREYQPIPIEREKVKPIVNTQPARPVVSAKRTKPAIIEQREKATVSESNNPVADDLTAVSEQPTKTIVNEATKPAGSELPAKPTVGNQPEKPATSEPPIKSVVSEPTHSADADTQSQIASTQAQQSTAQTKEISLESVEPAEVQKLTVATNEPPATLTEKPQAAEVRQETLAADTRVSEKQPTLHKKTKRDKVGVGERFEFTMEFQNSTPVDLASVQLTDPIDARLKVFSDQITVNPNYEHHVSVGNGQVVVRFTKEIKRGKHVLVTVPVMFPVTSAAAAQ